MRRIILIIIALLMLTGCTPYLRSNMVVMMGADKGVAVKHVEVDGMHISSEMRPIILEINDLREKYKEDFEKNGFEYLYLEPYDARSNRARNVILDNTHYGNKEYFYDVVEILNENIAPGIRDFIQQMEKEDLGYTKGRATIKIEKIGRTTVYVENRTVGDNYISIRINLLDPVDDNYNKIYNQISDDKYVLEDIIMGEKQNLIEFVNANLSHHHLGIDKMKIRYHLFFKDYDMKKVNILLRGEKDMDLENDDIQVFFSLLNYLDLQDDEKAMLLKEYTNIFKQNKNKETIHLANYQLNINHKKGNTYSDELPEYRYLSLERK